MKRKLTSLLLALVLCIGLLPTVVFAADSDFTIKDGVLEKYTGPGGNVTIPDSITSIGWSAI